MYHFIINPNSRSGKGALIWQDLKKILDERGIKYEAHLTGYRGHAGELAGALTERHTSESPVNLIAVGGDGTIQEILSGIRDLSAVRFGYIPTGSGNDFCRGMKLPQNSGDALDMILKNPRTFPMDVPRITCGGQKSRFAISCGIGFDAAVCHEVGVTPMKKILNRLGLGKLVYLFVALKQLLFLKPSPMAIQLDGSRKLSFKKVYFIAVMNLKYEGGGFKFCPDARPNDGLLDIIVVEGLNKPTVLACLPTAFFGKHTHFKGIHIYQARRVSVRSKRPLPIHTDGEAAGIRNSFSVEMDENPINIFLRK